MGLLQCDYAEKSAFQLTHPIDLGQGIAKPAPLRYVDKRTRRVLQPRNVRRSRVNVRKRKVQEERAIAVVGACEVFDHGLQNAMASSEERASAESES